MIQTRNFHQTFRLDLIRFGKVSFSTSHRKVFAEVIIANNSVIFAHVIYVILKSLHLIYQNLIFFLATR